MVASRRLEEHQSGHAAEEDELDGVDFIDGAADEGEEEEEDADVELPWGVGRAEVFGGEQEQGGGGEQAYHGGAQALEDVFYHGMVFIFHQEFADYEHEDE